MISNSIKRAPKPSLDDLLDDLISTPSDIDTQLVGGVVADKAKSSKIIKGQAELVELNAWINANNKRPDVESPDFKERQLARRMNGYAFQPKDHEDLKPFDKYGLIDADLYQKPLVKFDDYEDSTPLDLLSIEAVLADNVEDATIEPFFDETTTDTNLFDPDPITATSSTVGDVAAAILKLRAIKANELIDADSVDDEVVETNQQATPDSDTVAIIDTNEDQGSNEPLAPVILYAPSLSYLNIYYNPPATALSPFDITYISKYSPFTFSPADTSDDATSLTDAADDILQAFNEVPLQDYVPDSYEDGDVSWFDVAPQAPTELDSSGFEISGDSFDIAHPKIEPATVCTPNEFLSTKDTETISADKKANVEPKPTKTHTSDVYWSIDGDYDTAIINSDSATGLTQRHNPEPPLTADQSGIHAPAYAPQETVAPPTMPALKNDRPNDSTANHPEASKRLSNARAVVDNARPRIGLNPSTRTAPQGDSKHKQSKPSISIPEERKESKNTVAAPTNDNKDTILTSIDYFLNDAVGAGMRATESKTSKIETFDSLEDILDSDLDFLESLSSAEDKYFDMANQFGATSGDRATPDEVGKQTPCTDFYMHEAYFKILHRRLETGDLKTIKYTATNLKEGDAFILEGMVGFIQSFGEDRTGAKGTSDPRLRLIFDNKTESNILLSSLNRRLYKDRGGKRIIPSSDDFTDFDSPDTEKRIRTGQVYIVRTLSDNPVLKGIPNLYKIGFTRSTVEDRIKNATRDTAFLESPVEIILKADCFNTNPAGLEGLIHGFLAVQRVNIKLTGKNGGQYEPQEWFSIDLEEAKKVIVAIMNNEILDYRMDNTTGRMVAR